MNAVAGNAALAALLRRKGIRDARVLAAMEATDRALFVSPAFAERAYEDEALPIEGGQTISQPYVVAAMTEALAVGPDMRVLEIGAGSGYQTAILARLAAHVYAVEAHEELARQARARLSRLGLENVTLRVGDGALGWPEATPFERLLAAAAAPELPQAWWEQIAEGGRIVAPLGAVPARQKLVLIEKANGRERRRELMPVRFVPLLAPKIAGSN